MKKRRELDALIGKSRRENSGADPRRYEIESLSSLSSPDAETFVTPSGYIGIPSKRIGRSSNGCGCTIRRMIRICLPTCFLSLVAACITACIGIVWMQVQLKTDVERLTSRISKLETWQQVQPSTLDEMKLSISSMEKEFQSMKHGENGVKDVAEKLAVLDKKFEEEEIPHAEISRLGEQAVDLKQMFEELKSSISNMKSTMDRIDVTQKKITASHDKIQEDLKNLRSDVNRSNVQELTDLVSSSKHTAESDISLMNSTVLALSSSLNLLGHKVDEVELKISPGEILKITSAGISNIEHDIKTLEQIVISQNDSITSVTKLVNGLQHKIMANDERDYHDEKVHVKVTEGKTTAVPSHEMKANQKIDQPITSKVIPQDSTRPGQLERTNDPVNKRRRKSTYFSGQDISAKDLWTAISNRFDELKNEESKLSRKHLEHIFGKQVGDSLRILDEDHDGFLSRWELLHSSQNPKRYMRHMIKTPKPKR